jgi:hypothetical protein
VKEYNKLCAEQGYGEKVDVDRLYFLELIVRNRLWESLIEDELNDLELFKATEETKEETKAQKAKKF